MLKMRDITSTFFLYKQKVFLSLALAVLLVLGSKIPALAYVYHALHLDAPEQLGTLSLFSYGFLSWTTAWGLVQIFILLKHVFTAVKGIERPLVNPFALNVVVLAGLLSVLYWYGILIGIVPIYAGRELANFELLCGLIVGVTGTMLYIFVGHLFNAIRAGYGFWLLIGVQALWGAGSSLTGLWFFVDIDKASLRWLLFAIALFIAQIVVAVLLVQPVAQGPDRTPRHTLAVCMLTGLLSEQVATFVYTITSSIILAEGTFDLAMRVGILASLCLAVLLVLGCAIRALSWWIIVVGITFLFAATEVTISISPFFWPDLRPVHLVVFAWMAREALALFKVSFQKTQPPFEDQSLFDEDFRRGWR